MSSAHRIHRSGYPVALVRDGRRTARQDEAVHQYHDARRPRYAARYAAEAVLCRSV